MNGGILMKMRKFFFLLMVLILILSVYGSKHRVLPESTLLTNSVTTQIILPTDTVEDTSVNDEFHAFIEKWKLSDLLPQCRTMTIEQQDEFIKYFQQFDDVTRNYILLLLQGIAADTITCGELNGSHSSLFTNGSGRFVRYEGHMGIYDIDVSTLEGTTLKTQKIADGVLGYGKNEDYPKLDKYDYGDYNQSMPFSDIPTLFLAAAG